MSYNYDSGYNFANMVKSGGDAEVGQVGILKASKADAEAFSLIDDPDLGLNLGVAGQLTAGDSVTATGGDITDNTSIGSINIEA